MAATPGDGAEVPVLNEHVPVTMPDLPPRLVISTAEQFKAIAEPTRSRILGIIQNQPATAKQIADRLKIAPGAAGHHLQVLEAAGLAQVVARRLVRGIVAKYYARTARIFAYDVPSDVTGGLSPTMDIVTTATRELAETLAEASARQVSARQVSAGEAAVEGSDDEDACLRSTCLHAGFPHARISPERAAYYRDRLDALVEEMIAEPHEPAGEVYGMCLTLFRSPDYMQTAASSAEDVDAGDGNAVADDERTQGDDA
jgi:DNA-binding transcriptional ArsR family regulator